MVINADEISSNHNDRTLHYAEFVINVVTTDNNLIFVPLISETNSRSYKC
jgi:hypothetical protein